MANINYTEVKKLFEQEDDGELIPEGWYHAEIAASLTLEMTPHDGTEVWYRLLLRYELDGVSEPLITHHDGDPDLLKNETLMDLVHGLGLEFQGPIEDADFGGLRLLLRVEHAECPCCGEIFAYDAETSPARY